MIWTHGRPQAGREDRARVGGLAWAGPGACSQGTDPITSSSGGASPYRPAIRPARPQLDPVAPPISAISRGQSVRSAAQSQKVLRGPCGTAGQAGAPGRSPLPASRRLALLHPPHRRGGAISDSSATARGRKHQIGAGEPQAPPAPAGARPPVGQRRPVLAARLIRPPAPPIGHRQDRTRAMPHPGPRQSGRRQGGELQGPRRDARAGPQRGEPCRCVVERERRVIVGCRHLGRLGQERVEVAAPVGPGCRPSGAPPPSPRPARSRSAGEAARHLSLVEPNRREHPLNVGHADLRTSIVGGRRGSDEGSVPGSPARVAHQSTRQSYYHWTHPR